MRQISLAIGLSAALLFSLGMGGVALADEAAKATTTGNVKPGIGKGPEQSSMPSSAAPATTGAKTGSTDQSKTVKAMNHDEKAKVEVEGK
jgi:hypothetical protein